MRKKNVLRKKKHTSWCRWLNQLSAGNSWWTGGQAEKTQAKHSGPAGLQDKYQSLGRQLKFAKRSTGEEWFWGINLQESTCGSTFIFDWISSFSRKNWNSMKPHEELHGTIPDMEEPCLQIWSWTYKIGRLSIYCL